MSSNLYSASEFQKLSFGDKGLRILATGANSVVYGNFDNLNVVSGNLVAYLR